MTKVGVPSRPSQSTPLLVDGVLYLSFPYYRVVALEPETGDEIWEYTAPGDWNSPEHQLHWTGGSMRGLAYWEGDDRTPPQIVFGTEEGELISLNAATGIPNPRFGSDGFVDMKTPDVMNGFPNMHYGISSGVAVWKHLVFTGVHNADETGSKGPAGDTRAWDLRTGELVWTFHTVPRPGEFGNDTWLDDSWRGGQRRQHVVVLHHRRGTRHPVHAAGVRPQRLLRHRPPAGTISSRTRSWQWTPRRESGCGTSRPSITTCGTWTCRCRRSSSTSSGTARRYRPSAS